MKNGDISNAVATYIFFIDGAGMLYTNEGGRWFRFLRRIALRFHKDRLMLRLIRIERRMFDVVRSLASNPHVVLKIMAFSPLEEFILQECVLRHVFLEHMITIVRSKEEFSDNLKMSDMFISNRYSTEVSSARRTTFNSADDAINNIGTHVHYGRKDA